MSKRKWEGSLTKTLYKGVLILAVERSADPQKFDKNKAQSGNLSKVNLPLSQTEA